jgi:hypothetical protein
MTYVGNFRNNIHSTAIKINDNFSECPNRTHRWLSMEASLFLTVQIGFLGGFMWRLQRSLQLVIVRLWSWF